MKDKQPFATETSASRTQRRKGQDDHPDEALQSPRMPSSLLAAISAFSVAKSETGGLREQQQVHTREIEDEDAILRQPGVVRIQGPHHVDSISSEEDEEASAYLPVAAEVQQAEEEDEQIEQIRQDARAEVQNELLDSRKVVVADEDQDSRSRKLRRWITIAIIVVLGAVSAVVAILSLRNKNDGDPTETLLSILCLNAAGPFRVGSTINGRLNETISVPVTCKRMTAFETSTSNGRWFQVTGSGSSMKAFTCSGSQVDTAISVFSGSCEQLVCIDSNDDFCGRQSLVSWSTEEDEPYFIFVSGTTEGSFVLSISPGYANDECQTASGPWSPDSATAAVQIQPVTAGVRTFTSPACGDSHRFDETSGLWYTARGTGKGLRTRVCQSQNNGIVRLAVYETEDASCTMLQCKVGQPDRVDAADLLCQTSGTAISWRSEEDVLYYIYIGVVFNASFADLDISLVEFETTHDVCEEAIQLEPMFGRVRATGSTKDTTHADSLPACKNARLSKGLWYHFLGSGTTMRASVCSGEESQLVSLNIFEKGCDDLNCVNGYKGGSSGCEISWISVEGMSYFALVDTGAAPAEFELSIQAYPIAPNDVCKDALAVTTTDNETIFGSTFSARLNDDDIFHLDDYTVPCRLFGWFMPQFVPALWYSVVGTGKSIELSTVNSHTTYDSIIAVAKGQCGNLECVEASDDSFFAKGLRSSTLSFRSSLGQVYYILLGGWSISAFDQGPEGVDAEDEILGQIKTEPPVGNFGLTVRELGTSVNDNCEQAEQVFPTGGIISGTTIGSSVSGVVGCAFAFEGRGVFYSVSGTGAVMRAQIVSFRHDFDVLLSVFKGSCGSLECVGGLARFKLGVTAPFGIVDWQSKPGVAYFIHVYGFNAVGAFALQVKELEERPSRPKNGCGLAGQLPLAAPTSTYGSGTSATYNSEQVPKCSSGSEQLSVWYELDGATEDGILVSTCSTLRSESSIGIQVYRGESCSLLSCVQTIQVSCADGQVGNAVAWNADVATQYYVAVETQAEGSFQLDSTKIHAPINDSCEKAIRIGVNDLVVGNTFLGALDSLIEDKTRPFCGPLDRESSGLWYEIIGTGSTLRVSTCVVETEMDTYLTLYSGVCGFSTLDCEGLPNDDTPGCGTSSAITWNSVAGDLYFLFVQGPTLEFGTFGLVLEVVNEELGRSQQGSRLHSRPQEVHIGDASNEKCEDAYEIFPASGVVYRGSTLSASPLDLIPNCPFNPPPISPGVFFRTYGTGKGFVMSTCNEGTSFNTGLRVYGSAGDCGSLTCIWLPNEIEDLTDFGYGSGCPASNFFTRKSHWQTTLGATYYIVLFGFANADVGNYSFSLEEVELASNDRCEDAQRVNTTDIAFISGSTLNATVDKQSVLCERFDYVIDYRLDMPGVWYHVRTAELGKGFRASTCSNKTTFDTKLSVFTGDDCDTLSCVDINDDSSDCGLMSSIEWKASPGKTYYLEVHGYYLQQRRGNFGLTIEEFAVTPNDVCFDAILVDLSPEKIVLGSTTNAFMDESVPFCFFPTGTSKSVWYKVVGSGRGVRASTCTESTDFDTRIAVYAGDNCETLSCLTANSDSAELCDSNGDASSVQWYAAVNKTYHVMIFGAPPNEFGNFGLIVEEVDVPQNDLCLQAQALDSGDVSRVTVTTSTASYDYFAPHCNVDGKDARARGVWFRIEGKGGRLRASTCFFATSFAALLSVYTGFCDRLDCRGVTTEKSFCISNHEQSTVSWPTVSGVQYLLLVYGSETDAGTVQLSLSELEAPTNDVCSSAALIGLVNGRAAVVSSSFTSTIDENAQACSGSFAVNARGVWYKLGMSSMAPNSEVVASACSQSTKFAARLSVYSGDCTALSCVSALDLTVNDPSCREFSTVRWRVLSREESFYIFVHGASESETGEFGLSFEVS